MRLLTALGVVATMAAPIPITEPHATPLGPPDTLASEHEVSGDAQVASEFPSTSWGCCTTATSRAARCASGATGVGGGGWCYKTTGSRSRVIGRVASCPVRTPTRTRSGCPTVPARHGPW